VAEWTGRQSPNEVQIFITIAIQYPGAFATHEHYARSLIGIEKIRLISINKGLIRHFSKAFQ
jgi:hypothetical protein